MTDLAAAVRVAVGAVNAEGLACGLIGGFAVSVRTEPRFTRDLDLAVAVSSDEEAEALTRRLLSEGHEVLATVEQDDVGRLAMARLRLIGGDQLDLLFASSGIEPEVVGAAEPLEILPEVVVSVATSGHLIALKLLSRSQARPTDDADLQALLGNASPEDLAAATDAVALIEERGYARGRDLQAAVRTLIAEGAG